MNPADQPASRVFAFRPWFIWITCVVAVVQAWAFVDNVIDHEWVLAICFGLATVASVVQAVALLGFAAAPQATIDCSGGTPQ